MSKIFEHLHKFGPAEVAKVIFTFEFKGENIEATYGPIDGTDIWCEHGDGVELIVVWKGGNVTSYPALYETRDGVDQYDNVYELEQKITIDKIVRVW